MPNLTSPCAHVRQSQKRDGLFSPILLTAQILHPSAATFFLGPVKGALDWRQFSDDNELKQCFRDVLRSLGSEFYNTGIHRLTERRRKYGENDNDFVGK
jgi:hypothetical protein